MPKISDLLNHEEQLEVPYFGQVVSFVYRPGRFTSAFRVRIRQEAKAEAGSEESDLDARLIAGLVKEWNITGEDDAPLPIELEAIRSQMSYGLQGAIVQAMHSDIIMGGKAQKAAARKA